jgi:uncharacterized protein YjbI with pentapeptide repeats
MDKHLTSEKERLAARIAELEARLSAVQTASSNLGTREVTADQTYGDYIYNAEDTEHVAGQADMDAAFLDFNNETVDYEKFKYALSPEERRRPKANQAKSWKASDGGERVYYTLKKYYDERIGKSDPNERTYTSKVDAGENELYVFHDWQKNVFVMDDDENNNKLTPSEIKDHLKYWVMGDKESIVSNVIIDPATGKEMTDVDVGRNRAFDPKSINYDLENINQLKAMIKIANDKKPEGDQDFAIIIDESEELLKKMLKEYNKKLDVNALVALDKIPGTSTNGKFLQVQLGRVNNVMNNIKVYKDVAWFVGEEKPTDDSTPVTIAQGAGVGADAVTSSKTNYIKLDSKDYGTLIAKEGNPGVADLKKGVFVGPWIDLNSEQFNDQNIWLCYTIVSEEGPDLKVCENYNNKELTIAEAEAAAEAASETETGPRKIITSRPHAIENMSESVAPLLWYKPILTNISFPDYHFQNRIPAGTNLRDADFEGSDLTGVSLINCDIRGANFKDCVIVNTNFAGCTWDETTIWPLGFGDIMPDYFTILGDGSTYGIGSTFTTLKDSNKKIWFPWSDYIGSNGSHDPSGNSNDGTWNGAANLGEQHWLDNSGNGKKPKEWEQKMYIENSSVMRMSAGMLNKIYEAAGDNNYPDIAGTKLSGKIEALVGIPPTFVVALAGQDTKEYKRGGEHLNQGDVSSCYVIPGFFTKESATLWGATSVTISPLMRMIARGSYNKKFRKLGDDILKKSRDSTSKASDSYFEIYQEHEGLYKGENQPDTLANGLTNQHGGRTVFTEITINIKPLQNLTTEFLSTVNCPTHPSGKMPLAKDESLSKVPYNVIFNYDGQKPVDVETRNNYGDDDDEDVTKQLVGEITYIHPYETHKKAERIGSSRYQRDNYVLAPGEQSKAAVEEFLNVAEFPSFSWCPFDPLTLGTDDEFKALKTNTQMAEDFGEWVMQEPTIPMHEFPSDIIDLVTMPDGQKIGTAPRFLRYPFQDMQEANFQGSKFGYYEYNHNLSQHPDSINLKTNKGKKGFQNKFYATFFKNINLQKANFVGADLNKCIFHGCDLRETDFSGADIRGAMFINCKYSGTTRFDYVNGNDSDMMNIHNVHAAKRVKNRGNDCVRFFNLEAFEYPEEGLRGPNIDMSASFVNAKLQGVEIIGYAMGGCHDNANMKAGIFHNVQILGKKRNGNEMKSADYRYTLHFGNAFYRELDFLNDPVKATKENVDRESKLLIFPLGRSVDFTQNCITTEPTHREMAFAGEKHLMNSNFVEEDMSGCNFTNANLTGSDFSGCALHYTVFVNTIATDCSFNGANMFNVNAVNAKFNRSYFEKANLTGRVVDAETHEIAPESTLAGADFGGCDFKDATINYYNVTGTDFRADLSYSKGTGVDDRTIGPTRNWKGTWFKDTRIANLKITQGSAGVVDLSSNNGSIDDISPQWPQGFEYYVDEIRNGKYVQIHPPINRDINDANALRDGPTIFAMMNGVFNRDSEGNRLDNKEDDSFLLDISGLTIANTDDGGDGQTRAMVFSSSDYEGKNLQYRTIKIPNLFWSGGEKNKGLDATNSIINDVKFDRCVLPQAKFDGASGNAAEDTTNNRTNTGTSFINITSYDEEQMVGKYPPGITAESTLDEKLKACAISFKNTNLTGTGNNKVFFNGSHIPYSDFTGANLENVDFGNSGRFQQGPDQTPGKTINKNSNLKGCIFIDSVFSAETSFEGAILDEAVFTDNKTLAGIKGDNLKIISAEGTNFTKADLSGCEFKPYGIQGRDTDLVMNKADFTEANITYCSFTRVKFDNVKFGSETNPLDLTRTKFLKCDIKLAVFNYSKFNQTLFDGILNQADNQDALISNEWPVGYYNCMLKDGVMTVFNWPSSSESEGGFKNETLNAPLAEIMLRHGVYDMQRKIHGQPNFEVIVGASTEKRIRHLRLDYQAPDTFAEGKEWITDPELYAKNMSLMTGAPYVYPYVEGHWADKGKANDALVHRPKPKIDVPRKRINCSNSDASGVIWDACDIYGVDFTGSKFNYGQFIGCHFYECIFDKCEMNRMQIIDTQFDTCSFNEAKMNTLGSCPDNNTLLLNCVALDCTFTKTEMNLAHLKNVQMSNCKFDETDFTDAFLERCGIARVPVADSLIEDKERYGSGRLLGGRRGLYSNLATAIIQENKKRKAQGLTEIGGAVYAGDLKPGKVINIDNYSSEGQLKEYNDELKKTKAYEAAVDEVNQSNQLEEKRFLWKPKAVRFPKRDEDNVTNAYTAIEDNDAEEDSKNGSGGAYHCDFRTSIFKNTLFDRLSIEGKTEDLHGVNEDYLPPGMLDKLYNNAISTSTGSKFDLDSSGNMQNVFERLAWWDGQGGEGSKINILSGYKAMLPKQISTIHGEYELSYNRIPNDGEYADTYVENLTTRPGYGNIELFNEWEDGAMDGPRYHKPGMQGWYADADRSTNEYSYIWKQMSRRTNNCGFDTTLQGGNGDALNGDGIAFKDISGASRIDGPTFRERILKGVKHFPTASMARKVDLSGVSRDEKNFSKGTSAEDRLILRGIILSEAKLSGTTEDDGCQFVNADCTGANFAGADLTFANFSGAILRDCVFDDANLSNVNFYGANLIGTDLRKAIIDGIKIDSNTQFREIGVDKTKTTGKPKLSDYPEEGVEDDDYQQQLNNYDTLSAKIGDFTHVFPENALPNRYIVSQTSFDDTTKYGPNIKVNVNVGTGDVEFPYGLSLASLKTDGEFDLQTNLKLDEITKSTWENATALNALKGGIPLAGGKNYAVTIVNKLKGQSDQLSHVNVNTTNHKYWKWLSRNSVDNGRAYVTNFVVDGFRPDGYPLSYDTIDSNSGVNKVDFRQEYIFALGMPKNSIGAQPNHPIHFPPTKDGDLMLYSITGRSDVDKRLTGYNDAQPRYDFSTPDVLGTGETRTTFTGCDMHDSILPYSNFTNAIVNNVTFDGAVLRGCNFKNADLNGSTFIPSHSLSGEGKRPLITDLVRVSFDGADLRNCNFNEANLAHADFSGAKIEGCTFWGANLCNADFTKADFGTGANFVGAGPWYFTAPGYNSSNGETNYTKFSMEEKTNLKTYWILVNEGEVDKLGYVDNRYSNPSFYSDFRGDRVAFYFEDEAKTQPRSLIHDSETTDERIKAHEDALTKVLPKMPKGFNIMRAFGWERDASGVIQSRYRNELILLPQDGTSNVPVNYRDTVTHIIDNNFIPPDTGAIGVRNNGTDFSGNPLGHKALPITHTVSITSFLTNLDLSGVNNPDKGFEYGVGVQAIRDGTQLSGLSGLKHYENAIKTNYFHALNEPISDISGVTLHHEQEGANFQHIVFAQKTLKFEFCDLSGMDMSSAVVPENATSFHDTSCNRCKFDGAVMRGADFKGANTLNLSTFYLTDLTNADFSGVDLTGAKFTNVPDAATALADKNVVHTDAIFKNTNFANALNANLADWPLGFDYSGAVVSTAEPVSSPSITEMKAAGRYNFVNLPISGDLTGLDLSGAVLNNCKIDKSTNLTNVDFSGANLTGVDFGGCNLEKTNFTNWTVIEKTLFNGAINANKATSWPQGFNYDAAVDSVTKESAILLNQNKLWYDYSANANPSRVDLWSRHDMSSNNPTEFEKNVGYPLVQPQKDENGNYVETYSGNSVAPPTLDNSKNFVGQKIEYVNFNEESFYNSTLGISYDFSGASIENCSFYKADLSGANFTDVADGSLVGCDFTNANLTNADFSGCNLLNAVFLYSKLNNTNLYGVKNSHNAYFPAGFDFLIADAGQRVTYDPTTVATSVAQILGNKRTISTLGGKYEVAANAGDWQVVSDDTNKIYKPVLPTQLIYSRRPVGDDDEKNVRTHSQGARKGEKYDHRNWETFPNADGTNKTVGGYNLKETTDLSNARLDPFGNDINKQWHFLRYANLTGADLTDTNLQNSDLTGVDLSGADLSGTIFTDCKMQDKDGNLIAPFVGVTIDRAVFDLAHINDISNQFLDVETRTGRAYSEATTHQDGKQVPNLRGLSAKSVNLGGYSFANCDLQGADFTNSILANCDFSGADLTDAVFIGADLNGVDLRRSCIEGADFRLSNFIDISGRGAIWDANTKFPLGFELEGETDKRERFTQRTSAGAVSTGADVKANFDFSKINNARRALSGRVADKNLIVLEDDFKDIVFAVSGGQNLAHWNSGNTFYNLTASNDLSYNVFTGPKGPVDLSGSNFTGSSLKESTFIGANLTAAKFRDLDVSATDFRNAILNKAEFKNIDMSYNKGIRPVECPPGGGPPEPGRLYLPVEMTKVKILDSNFDGVIFAEGTDLSAADLSGTSFIGAVMQKANFYHADLTNTDLSGCHCNDSIFQYADLSSTNINGAAFGDVRLDHATLTDISLCCVKDRNLGNTSMDYATIINSDLSGNIWEGSAIGAKFHDLSFNNVDFSICDSLDLSGAKFFNVSFHKSDFKGTNFSDTDVSYSNFKDCSMNGVNFTRADVRGADFSGVDLTNVKLNDANMREAIFTGATVVGLTGTAGSTDLSGAKMNKLILKDFSFEGSHITNVNLSESDLSGVDFSGATIEFSNSSNKVEFASAFATEIQRACSTQGINNNGIKLNDVTFVGEQPLRGTLDLSRVLTFAGLTKTDSGLDLSNCLIGPKYVWVPATGGKSGHYKEDTMPMQGVSLPSADFTNAVLRKVDLSGSNLGTSDFSGADLTETNFTGCNLNTSDFTKAHLHKTNFTRAILSYSNFEGQDLSSAIFYGTNFYGADLSGITRAGISCADELIGNNFERSNLFKLDLSNCQLMGVNFKDASMNTVDLSNSDLSGAIFTQTHYLGADDKFARSALIHANLHASHVKNLDHAILHDMSFDAIDLSAIKSGGLTGTSFAGSELAGAIFSGLTLTDVDFSGCDLTGAKFVGSVFRGDINLQAATITNMDISNADLSGTKLAGTSDHPSIGYASLNYHKANRLHAIDLQDASLRDQDLSGLKLLSVNLTNADLSGADLSGADLTGGQLWSANLSSVNFKFANLKSVDFYDADLSHADLSGSDLTGANFTLADLSSANFDNATISQTTFYQVTTAPTVSGKDKHRYYSNPNGSIPDGPTGFRNIVSNIIVDISGQNLAINSRGHVGYDGEPEATHPDIDDSCYNNLHY